MFKNRAILTHRQVSFPGRSYNIRIRAGPAARFAREPRLLDDVTSGLRAALHANGFHWLTRVKRFTSSQVYRDVDPAL